MICRECGKEMKERVVQKGGHYKPRLIRFICQCGYEESKERTMEKLSNDFIEDEIKRHNEDQVEPSYDPYENE